MWGPGEPGITHAPPTPHAAHTRPPQEAPRMEAGCPLLHPGQCPCSSVNFHQLSQITPLFKTLKNTAATSHQPSRPCGPHGKAKPPLHALRPGAHGLPSFTRALPSPGRGSHFLHPLTSGLGSEPTLPETFLPSAPDATVKWKPRGSVPLKTQQGSRAVRKTKLAGREDPKDEPWGSDLAPSLDRHPHPKA